MLLSRWLYYLTSLPTLLIGVKNWPSLAIARARGHMPRPFMVELRSGLRFQARTPMDVWIIKESCLDRQYERASVALEDGWTVIDIGAGLGDFTIHAAKDRPRSRVFAYEPFPESFALLQYNLTLNGVENVTAFSFAIGAGSSAIELRVVSGEAVQHTTVSNAALRESVRVPSLTLDRAFADLQLECCDYLKVDCEGAEYDIFFNASNSTLKKIRHICLEYHDGVTPHTHDELIQFFEGKGFRVRCVANPVHRQLGLMHAENPTGWTG